MRSHLRRPTLPSLPRLLASLCISAALYAGPAAAQDFAAAGEHFAAAQEAFAKQDFTRAATEYQATYNITKDPALLYNIGESWQRAGDGPKAVAAYRSYLKDQPTATDRAEAERRIASIEAALSGKPAPEAAQPGAAPKTGETPAIETTDKPPESVPGAATGKTPEAGQPGERTKPPEAAKPEPAKPEASAVTITPKEEPPTRLRTAGWIHIASAVALATAGAIVGLGAQSRADELRRRTTLLIGDQPPVYDADQRDAYETLQRDGRAYNTASIVLLSVGGAAAVTGGALLIADLVKRGRDKAREEQKSPKPRWAGSLLPDGRGVQALFGVGGSF